MIRNQLLRPNWSALSSQLVRGAARDHRYGSEEGYDRKNEVRKDYWIRKRMRRPLGGDWRENMLKVRNPNEEGPLSDIPDWTFADGSPGVPSFKEIGRIETNKKYAFDIKEAYDLMKQSENAIKEKAKSEEKRTSEYLGQRLQPKGSKPFSDLL